MWFLSADPCWDFTGIPCVIIILNISHYHQLFGKFFLFISCHFTFPVCFSTPKVQNYKEFPPFFFKYFLTFLYWIHVYSCLAVSAKTDGHVDYWLHYIKCHAAFGPSWSKDKQSQISVSLHPAQNCSPVPHTWPWILFHLFFLLIFFVCDVSQVNGIPFLYVAASAASVVSSQRRWWPSAQTCWNRWKFKMQWATGTMWNKTAQSRSIVLMFYHFKFNRILLTNTLA